MIECPNKYVCVEYNEGKKAIVSRDIMKFNLDVQTYFMGKKKHMNVTNLSPRYVMQWIGREMDLS